MLDILLTDYKVLFDVVV